MDDLEQKPKKERSEAQKRATENGLRALKERRERLAAEKEGRQGLRPTQKSPESAPVPVPKPKKKKVVVQEPRMKREPEPEESEEESSAPASAPAPKKREERPTTEAPSYVTKSDFDSFVSRMESLYGKSSASASAPTAPPVAEAKKPRKPRQTKPKQESAPSASAPTPSESSSAPARPKNGRELIASLFPHL